MCREIGKYRIRVAGWFWRRILDWTDSAAVTLPSRTIYFHPEHVESQRVLAHELTHIKQIDRDGAFIWAVKIIWYFCRYGYWNSPYEVEAREAENILQ